jgi:hypothetical protein
LVEAKALLDELSAAVSRSGAKPALLPVAPAMTGSADTKLGTER